MRNAEFFNHYLDYNEKTGEFKYKPRSIEEFGKEGEFKRWNNRYAGKPAGGYCLRRGYYNMLRIRVCWGRYVGSRIAAVMCGLLSDYHDPRHIDHIDGDPTNNRIENLRVVDESINSKNRKMSIRNTTGVTGVKRASRCAGWTAVINDDCKEVYLGYFKHLFEAVCARRSAEIRYGYTSRHGR